MCQPHCGGHGGPSGADLMQLDWALQGKNQYLINTLEASPEWRERSNFRISELSDLGVGVLVGIDWADDDIVIVIVIVEIGRVIY